MKPYGRLPWFYLALGLAQAGHSTEEVLTGLWMNFPIVTGAVHRHFPAIPVLSWSAVGFAAANLIIVALLLGFSPLPFLNRGWAWKIVWVVALIETLNGLMHITGAMVTGGYFSGCISAVFLLGIGTAILIESGRKHGPRPL